MNVDTGQFRAVQAQMTAMSGQVAALGERVAEATAVEAIIRRAVHPGRTAATPARASGAHAVASAATAALTAPDPPVRPPIPAARNRPMKTTARIVAIAVAAVFLRRSCLVVRVSYRTGRDVERIRQRHRQALAPTRAHAGHQVARPGG